MDATIITVVGAAIGGTITTAATVTTLVSRSIGNLRSQMDQRFEALIHDNQQAHDAIGLRIETQGGELRERIDALDVRLARTSEDVSFIKGRLTADGTG